ncbi:hypothetical protein [Silvanigrella aquatica]|uniref:Uncharacterized protein n=1 Tax=Silvanigrella aquatica TaxID=1915309 RepID=A0A1L4D0B7_9BACT|nr:hypothetical protein [Silvanigrella aquatica]APJ03651.1 hypothetical protein AXG55_06915 [Silvanigrella aquatica]
MIGLKKFLGLFVLIFPLNALSSSFPTKWKIINNTDLAIEMKCQLGNINHNIVLKTNPILPHAQYEYNWGQNFYNEGLGLNPGVWNCYIKKPQSKMFTQEFKAFTTDWGETLTIILESKEGKITLKKQ